MSHESLLIAKLLKLLDSEGATLYGILDLALKELVKLLVRKTNSARSGGGLNLSSACLDVAEVLERI